MVYNKKLGKTNPYEACFKIDDKFDRINYSDLKYNENNKNLDYVKYEFTAPKRNMFTFDNSVLRNSL